MAAIKDLQKMIKKNPTPWLIGGALAVGGGIYMYSQGSPPQNEGEIVLDSYPQAPVSGSGDGGGGGISTPNQSNLSGEDLNLFGQGLLAGVDRLIADRDEQEADDAFNIGDFMGMIDERISAGLSKQTSKITESSKTIVHDEEEITSRDWVNDPNIGTYKVNKETAVNKYGVKIVDIQQGIRDQMAKKKSSNNIPAPDWVARPSTGTYNVDMNKAVNKHGVKIVDIQKGIRDQIAKRKKSS